jgi:phospholipase A1
MKLPLLIPAALALAAAFPALAQAQDLGACRDIANNDARLACYDRAAGRAAAPGAPSVPAPSAPAAAAGVGAAAPAAAAKAQRNPMPERTSPSPSGWFRDDDYVPQTFSQRWELDPADQDGVWKIKAYKPVYALPVYWRSKVNESPCSPNPVNCAPGAGAAYQNTEAMFQLSLKTKAWQDVLGSDLDLWLGYTQQSFWQVYNTDESRPFRATNYQPEAWLTLPTKLGPEGLRWRMLNLGVVHESNGQSDPLSRSWNRLYATFGFEAGDASILVKPWWRIPESSADDNNPDITDYLGRIELQVVYPWRANVFSARLTNNLKFGSSTPNRTTVQADWAFPLYGNLHGYVQGNYGYDGSMQNYNFRSWSLGVGVSLVEWR